MHSAAQTLNEILQNETLRQPETPDQALSLLVTLLEAESLEEQEQQVASEVLLQILAYQKSFAKDHKETLFGLLRKMVHTFPYPLFSRPAYFLLYTFPLGEARTFLDQLAAEARFTSDQRAELELEYFHALR